MSAPMATACRLAEAGAITILCARRADGLATAAAQIQDHVAAASRPPAQVETHAVDLADLDACDALVQTLLMVSVHALWQRASRRSPLRVALLQRALAGLLTAGAAWAVAAT